MNCQPKTVKGFVDDALVKTAPIRKDLANVPVGLMTTSFAVFILFASWFRVHFTAWTGITFWVANNPANRRIVKTISIGFLVVIQLHSR